MEYKTAVIIVKKAVKLLNERYWETTQIVTPARRKENLIDETKEGCWCIIICTGLEKR